MNNNILPSQNLYIIFAERASVFTSRKKKASVTVEAAMAVPIFFLAVISLLYLLEIMAIQTSVRSGMQYAAKELAKEAYTAPVIIPWKLEGDIVNAVGAERLGRSIVVGGSAGIHCQESHMSAVTGIATIKVSYDIKMPLVMFQTDPVTYQQEMKVKAWTGYEKSGFSNQDEETVYVTETGLVYHKDYHCTYLELSIHMVQSNDLEALRNESGAKYYPCEHCLHGSPGGVYITDTGNRYHSSLGCSGLKRTIYAVPVSEAAGKGACSRCGK